MRRPYEPPAYDTTIWPDSHWRTGTMAPAPRLEGAKRAAFAVIGAGYTGLNAALELVARTGAEVAVIDAGQPGWGASGRNGGFACMGGTKLSPRAIVRRVGIEGAQAMDRFQKEAVAAVDANLADHAILADRGPDGEVALAHRARDWAGLQAGAAAERALYGTDITLIDRDGLRRTGIHVPGFYGAAVHPVGFALHPMKYLAGLARGAREAGVRMFGDSPVTGLRREAGGWVLTTPTGELRAARVLVATNGYSSDDLPGWMGGRFLPALSTILVTRPLTNDERAEAGWTSARMAFDTRTLLHYFRLLPDGRFLFGMRGGLSASAEALARTERRARAHFEAMFPDWRGIATERTWSGLVCLTGSRAGFVGAIPGAEGLFAAFGWHGNGVSTGTLAGQRVAVEMAGGRADIPALLRLPPRRIPFRRAGLALAYAAYALADGPIRRPYS